MSEPVVAIVGRPNVGKSTLFNRLVGRRQAIVDDMPGVTRDRNQAIVEWAGLKFLLIDTGGYLPASKETIDRAVREQIQIAIETSDVIVFLVDVRTGITSTDQELARFLKTAQKNVILVVNKVDEMRHEAETGEFYKLGLGDPNSVSAMTGRQSGDLLDVICSKINKVPAGAISSDAIKLAIIGKENVGKSSLVNMLLQQERQIVTDIPGTTRDSIDSQFRYQNRDYILIDTAGLKKKAKITENVLFYSNVRTYRSISRCDVVLYLVNAPEGLTKQDLQVLMDATKAKKGIICLFNKWDLVEKDQHTMDKIRKDIEDRLGELRFIPAIFTSVPDKQRLYKALDLATEVFFEKSKRIPTAELNSYFLPLFKNNPPPATQGKEMKINYATQIKAASPLFAFYCNHPKLIPENYRRFVENKLREKFGFVGVPLSISFRKK